MNRDEVIKILIPIIQQRIDIISPTHPTNVVNALEYALKYLKENLK